MKSFITLLVLTIGIGAAYWTTQRPGEGLDALQADAQSALARLQDGVQGFRSGLTSDSQQEDAAAAFREALGAADEERIATLSRVDELERALNVRVDAIENQLTGTMTAAEAATVDNRLSELEQALASAAQTSATDDAETVSSEAVAELSAALDTALQRVASLEDQLSLTVRRLDESDASERLDQLSVNSEALGTRLDTLSAGAIRQSQDSEAVIAGLGERLDTLDARIATVSASQSSNDNGDTQAAPELDAAIDKRLAALEDKLETTGADQIRLEALSARFDALDQRLNAAESNRQSLDEAIAGVNDRLNDLDTRASALSIDTVQQEIRQQLTALETEASSDAGADIDTLNEALEATRERIAELESQVQELPPASNEASDVQQTQSALEAQIAALEQRLETLPSASLDAELASSLSEVRDRVEELSTRDFVTQEELRAQVEGRNVEYKIYFAKNSVDISDEAAQVLNSFISQETNRATGVSIFGFTDRAGPASFNQRLAERRAQVVRSYLIQNGFDFTKIGNVAGLGEDAAATLLEDDAEDAEQRVVVLYASQR